MYGLGLGCQVCKCILRFCFSFLGPILVLQSEKIGLNGFDVLISSCVVLYFSWNVLCIELIDATDSRGFALFREIHRRLHCNSNSNSNSQYQISSLNSHFRFQLFTGHYS